MQIYKRMYDKYQFYDWFVCHAENLKIILIDGEQLAQLMIDHDIGVTEESRYIVKKIDLDYFSEE